MDSTIEKLRKDLRADQWAQQRVDRARGKIIKALATVPDDDGRRRVLYAVAILLGHAEVPRSWDAGPLAWRR